MNLVVRILVLTVSLLGVGCAPSVLELTYEATSDLHQGPWTPNEERLILDSATRWNQFAGHPVVHVRKTERKELDNHIQPAAIKPSANALHDDTQILVDVWKLEKASDNAEYDTKFRALVMHEIGHALGFAHQETGLMGEVVEDQLTEADRIQCRELGLCD